MTLSFIEPTLEGPQDRAFLGRLAEGVLSRGTGAERQRAALGSGEDMDPVMQDLITRTQRSWQE